ncbi:CsbD family protein [Streptococcus pluranimalium]|uniref:CsbD family protein n=1 Tax=Streptococcus TaxID=1301 RepID=UPI001478C94F|nr:CsbD family protein [Streptococcus hyovaginalis]
MSEEKFNAKAEQVSGSVKEGLGKLTGDKRTESEGKTEKASGSVKEILADAKDAVKGAIDGLKK